MAGAPSICPTLLYRDARAAIKLLTESFGFSQVAVHEGEDGSITHAELSYGNGVVMLGSSETGSLFAQAMGAHRGAAGVYVVVEGVDEHYRRAVEHGVEILMEPTDQDYGARDYMARDPEGNIWSFGTYAPAP
ncbi:VOC family protein [Streptomyces sp. NPDC006879]|uniref:VOC family protein n=1 Tax=Streptomyces sp. NPDC006879 TaxID=3364767 RepID=UPI0036CE1047